MKQAEAKALALQLHDNEWLAEGREPVDQQGMGVLPFYNWLERNHPDVLKFRCTGDKYQVVATWFPFRREE